MGASSSVAARQVTPLLLRALSTMTGSLHTHPHPCRTTPFITCVSQSSARHSGRSTRGSRTACPAASSPSTVRNMPSQRHTQRCWTHALLPLHRVDGTADGRQGCARTAARARRSDGGRAVHQRARSRAPLGRRQGLPARLLCARARRRRLRARRGLPPQHRRLRQHRPLRPRRARPETRPRWLPFVSSSFHTHPHVHVHLHTALGASPHPSSQCCTTCCAIWRAL